VDEHPQLEVLWAVFVTMPERAAEARAVAAAFLTEVSAARAVVRDYLPYSGAAVKCEFEARKREFSPDVAFTHYRDDRHQDHRLVSELTWNTWRDHIVFEYEIPRYVGDFGSPNFFASLSTPILDRKVSLVLKHLASRRASLGSPLTCSEPWPGFEAWSAQPLRDSRRGFAAGRPASDGLGDRTLGRLLIRCSGRREP
jgi:LmbE family N-acetylglucosaminyl deacetylase